MRRGFFAGVVCLAIAACQTTGADVETAAGSGPVRMNSSTYENCEAYTRGKPPLAFALSEDGRKSFSVTCSDHLCNASGALKMAMDRCASANGTSCRLFAKGRDIVWRNPGAWQPWEGREALTGSAFHQAVQADLEESQLFEFYKKTTGQKAFAAAVSASGVLMARGTTSSQLTIDDAISNAERHCRSWKDESVARCRIIHLNGAYVGDLDRDDILQNADTYISTDFPKGRKKVDLTVYWEGIGEGLPALLTYHVPRSEGSMLLEMDALDGVLCKGTLLFINAKIANWTMACDDGGRLGGTLVRTDYPLRYHGKGKDDKGRTIQFETTDLPRS